MSTGDAPAVVVDADDVSRLDAHLDLRAEARQGLVDGVVHDLVDQVVQAAGGGGADVHPRPLPDRLQPLPALGSLRRCTHVPPRWNSCFPWDPYDTSKTKHNEKPGTGCHGERYRDRGAPRPPPLQQGWRWTAGRGTPVTFPFRSRQRRKDLGQVLPHGHHLAGLFRPGQKVPGGPGGGGVVQVKDPQHIPFRDDHRGPYVQIHDRAPPFPFPGRPDPFYFTTKSPRRGDFFRISEQFFIGAALPAGPGRCAGSSPGAQLPLRGLAAGDEDLPAGDAL